VDMFADIHDWDDYSSRFDLPPETAVVDVDPVSADMLRDEKALAGGFEAHKVWERAVRSAVMGLWLPPVGWEHPPSSSAEVMDVDVQMVDVAS
jgi:hypothetical protein